MSKWNKINADLLGMSWGAACNRLRKKVLFSLIVRLGENSCYRCGNEILSVDDLSLEHKNAWRQAADPVESFFDLDNISFSHLSCNSAAASKPNKKWQNAEERKAHEAEVERQRWHRLSKEEQQRIRRGKYLRNKC